MIEPTFDVEVETLRDALGIDPDDVAELPRFDVGHEAPAETPKGERATSSLYRSPTETDELLTHYLEDAEVGVTDAAIAKKAGLSCHQVKRWRGRHGITRTAGADPSGRGMHESGSVGQAETLIADESLSGTDEIDTARVREWLRQLPGDGVGAATWATHLGHEMRADPGLVQQVANMLRARGGALDQRTAGALVASLEAAGTPDAQDALCELAEDENVREADRMRAAAALNGIAEPTPDTVEALARLTGPDQVGPVRRTATLAAATIAQRSASNSRLGVRADSVADAAIREALESDPVLALDAIGNRAGSRHLATVEQFLDSEDVAQRTAAVLALRQQPAGVRVRLLRDRLANETDPGCIAAIATQLRDALDNVEPGVAASLGSMATDALSREPTGAAAVALVELVGRTSGNDPRAKETLLHTFWSTSDPALRSAIGRYVTAREIAASRPE